MKYKLINKITNEEHICDKVTIDGFDYYVNDETPKKEGEKCYSMYTKELVFFKLPHTIQCKRVIATTNLNIDIPKVMDGVEKEAMSYLDRNYSLSYERTTWQKLHEKTYVAGYNKSQETHPFSEEDMIEFGYWCENLQKDNKEIRRNNASITTKELLQIWKEQRVKVVYYQ